MSRPYFSTIICNYNYGRYLRQGLDSLLAQDFPAKDHEIVVVDDGSTDDSVAVVESYKDRVRLIKQKNQKQSLAYAHGFKEAKGEVFCLMDSDDWWEPAKLSKVAKRLEDPRVGLVQHWLRDTDAEGRPLDNPLPAWPARYRLEDFIAGRCEDAATTGLAFRRGVLEAALPVPPELFAFYDEWLIAHGLIAADMANIPEILGYHRIHGANNWAQRLASPDKMEGYAEQGRLFYSNFERVLAGRGKALEPSYKDALETDFSRSQLLAAVYRGDRALAWRLWEALPKDGGHACFRRSMLALALIHPDLYMGAYRLYSELPALRKARQALLPK
jgi:glycosyltransferase involved in cell wall biosynthesis